MNSRKTTAPPKAERLARASKVPAHYSFAFSEPSLWRWCKERKGFPQPRKIGPNTTVFSLDELDAFFAAEAAKRA